MAFLGEAPTSPEGYFPPCEHSEERMALAIAGSSPAFQNVRHSIRASVVRPAEFIARHTEILAIACYGRIS